MKRTLLLGSVLVFLFCSCRNKCNEISRGWAPYYKVHLVDSSYHNLIANGTISPDSIVILASRSDYSNPIPNYPSIMDNQIRIVFYDNRSSSIVPDINIKYDHFVITTGYHSRPDSLAFTFRTVTDCTGSDLMTDYSLTLNQRPYCYDCRNQTIYLYR